MHKLNYNLYGTENLNLMEDKNVNEREKETTRY